MDRPVWRCRFLVARIWEGWLWVVRLAFAFLVELGLVYPADSSSPPPPFGHPSSSALPWLSERPSFSSLPRSSLFLLGRAFWELESIRVCLRRSDGCLVLVTG